jgi:hypothetical protein
MIEEIGQVRFMLVVKGVCDDSPLPIPSDETSTIANDEDRE